MYFNKSSELDEEISVIIITNLIFKIKKFKEIKQYEYKKIR